MKKLMTILLLMVFTIPMIAQVDDCPTCPTLEEQLIAQAKEMKRLDSLKRLSAPRRVYTPKPPPNWEDSIQLNIAKYDKSVDKRFELVTNNYNSLLNKEAETRKQENEALKSELNQMMFKFGEVNLYANELNNDLECLKIQFDAEKQRNKGRRQIRDGLLSQALGVGVILFAETTKKEYSYVSTTHSFDYTYMEYKLVPRVVAPPDFNTNNEKCDITPKGGYNCEPEPPEPPIINQDQSQDQTQTQTQAIYITVEYNPVHYDLEGTEKTGTITYTDTDQVVTKIGRNKTPYHIMGAAMILFGGYLEIKGIKNITVAKNSVGFTCNF